MPEKNDFAGRYIYHEELDKIIAKAVKAERETCKNDIETIKKKYTYLFAGVCDDCIEAIDARSRPDDIK